MQSFSVWIPTRLAFGAGQFARAGEVAREFGRRAIVVTYRDPGPLTPRLDQLVTMLHSSGLETVLFAQAEPNPLSTTADAGAEVARRERCDLVVALGGGSAIDCGKAIALAAVNPGSIWEYMPAGDSPARVPATALPVVAITTTAGTGSEVDPSFVLTNPATREKPGQGFPMLNPKAAIVDPELMLSLPPRVTASTGLDVLFHALESYVGKGAQPFTDLLCEEAIRLVVGNLREAVQHGDDLEARSRMAWANCLGGVVIHLSGVILLHALGHSISAFHDAPHGETLVALARPFMEETYPANPAKFATLARLLGTDTAGLSPGEAAAASVTALDRFIEEVGLKVNLRELGAEGALVPQYARTALKTMQGCISGQPTAVTEQSVAELFRRSFGTVQ